MRHHNKNRKFGRPRNQRKALLRSLCMALIKSGKIKTTEAKAKEVRPFVEKLITKGKDKSIASRRVAASRLCNNKAAVKKLFDEIAPKYALRQGGYTRIIKLPARKSDSARMAVIEFV